MLATGVLLIAAGAAAVARPTPARADPVTSSDVVAQKKAEYQQIRQEVVTLDASSTALAEQYDKAKWQVHQLKAKIVEAGHRIKIEQAKLAFEESALSSLMVASYKGGVTHAVDIVLGANSLTELTTALDAQQRFDAAVSSAVIGIRNARDAIQNQRDLLVQEHSAEVYQEHLLATRRAQILKMLAKRRKLMRIVGQQMRIAEAADSIGQAKLALKAQRWVRKDELANAADPGQVERDQVVLQGLQQIGVPYVWGGASPQGFDCSGLVMWLWARHGVDLPHFAAAQYHLGAKVKESDLRIGDLVFFHHLGHVAIYIGNGYLLHAPHTGATVEIESFEDGWFQNTYVGATEPGTP
jgi:peptidoglycan DL-endopeptidase CwlO